MTITAAGKLSVPSGEGLADVTDSSEVQVVQSSGLLVVASGVGQSNYASGTKYAVAPANAVFHFPQSGYWDTGNEFPTDGDIVDTWNKTHDSSGLSVGAGITAVATRQPLFKNADGGDYGKLAFDGNDAFLHNFATALFGGSDVATIGAAFRTPPTDPSGTAAGIINFVTAGGGFSATIMVRASGTPRINYYDGSNAAQAHGETVLEADTNYTVVGVLKSDGDIKVFVNGTDDTFNKTNVFSGQIDPPDDLVIGATTIAYANQASGYRIVDVGLWLEDMEDNGKLGGYHAYLTNRFTSLDGS
jgi:hypothetical protein